MEFSRIIVDQNPKSAISESFRTIRTNLEFVNNNKSSRVISITSTISGEGKTFVATNLAGIIALSDQKVIIIDLDLRKPKVHKAFGKENLAGMSNLLIQKATLNSIIQKTNLPNLDFISSGPTPPNPSELILRPILQELIAELREKYDVIIMDTPPVGVVTDGILVMRMADIPLFVIRENYSKKAVKNTINKISSSKAFSNISVIFNGVKHAAGYGYGAYGYGYYENDKDEGSLLKKLNVFSRSSK
jgi:capsular exopolysaccharide synthesis family protein